MVPHQYIFGRHFVGTYVITNRSSSPSSTHHALTGDAHKLIGIDLLHIKCKFCTYDRPPKPKNERGVARYAFKTVPMTLTFHCDVTEGDCCSDYVVTAGMCVVRRACKGGIHQRRATQSFLACKSMGKFFVNGLFVMKPA